MPTYTSPRMGGITLSVELTSSLENARADWSALGERSDNVFATWEWLSTWWHHFGRDRPLVVGLGRTPDHEARVVLPLYLAARRPLQVLRPLGHGVTDQMGPVCEPGDRAAAADALRRLLDDAPLPWDLLVADELPADVDWAGVLGGRLLARQASPVTALEGQTWDRWLAQRSAGLRSTLRRARRDLDQMGTVRFRTTADPDRVDVDLDALFELHDARWSGRSRAFAQRKQFHHDFARQALTRGWLRLRFLEVDGRPAAALYNLRFAGTESYYQSGRDPRFDSYSIGLLLQADAVRDAIETGCREYRFLRGDEPYKRRFADRDPGLQSVGVAAGGGGRATLGALAQLPRLPRWAVRRVPAAYAWGTGGSPVWGPP